MSDDFECSGIDCKNRLDYGDGTTCECRETYYCYECVRELEDSFDLIDGKFETCPDCFEEVENEEYIKWLEEISGKTRQDYGLYLINQEFGIGKSEYEDEITRKIKELTKLLVKLKYSKSSLVIKN